MSVISFFEKIYYTIKPIVFNRYIIVLVTFGVYITFFDRHSLITRFKTNSKIKEMEEEYGYYEKEIKKNKFQLYKLKTDNQYLEQFAREKYLMRNKGEEIFIIKED